MVARFEGLFRGSWRAFPGLLLTLLFALASTSTSQSASDIPLKTEVQMNDQEIPRVQAAGRNILLVELYGTTTYVFDGTHEVAGPVLRVLKTFGFEPVLPEGVTIAADGLLPLEVEDMNSAPADHVLLMNFSRDEAFVGNLVQRLGALAHGRVYRFDSTASEAFSSEWREDILAPRIRAAISSGAGNGE